MGKLSYMQRRPITKEEVDKVCELGKEGLGYEGIAKIIGRNRNSVNAMISARNAGFQTPVEYHEHRAKLHGFDSLLHYGRCNRKTNVSKQREFEEKLILISEYPAKIADNSYISNIEREEANEVLFLALKALKERNYLNYEVVIRTVFRGETLETIGKDYHVSQQRINQRKQRGLEFLSDFLKEKEFSLVP